MTRSTVTCLLGLGVALLVALKLGGAQGTGVTMGFLGGAGLTCLGVMAQRYMMLHSPERVFQVHLLAFLLKLGTIGVMALLFETNDALAQRVDFAAFALSFAAAVAVILPVGAMDVARLGRASRASR